MEQDNIEEKRKKKKKGFPWILVIIIIFFLIPLYFSFEHINGYFYVKETRLVETPYNITKEMTYQKAVEHEICNNVSHRYSYSSGNVVSKGNWLQPNFIIYNLEEKWALFKVKIYYINEKEFPEEIYGGQNLFEKYPEEISEKDAEYESPWYEFYIGPSEGMKIDNKTLAKGAENVYWGMADVIVPEYNVCHNEVSQINITENRTFTEYKKMPEETKQKKFITLKDYLNISFGQWIVILIMLTLIIFLFLKIIELTFNHKKEKHNIEIKNS